MPVYDGNCILISNVSLHDSEQNQTVSTLAIWNVESIIECGQACMEFNDTLNNLTCNAFSNSKEECRLHNIECMTQAIEHLEKIVGVDDMYYCGGR